MRYSYIIIYKPFQVLSQFTSPEKKQTLKDYFDVAKDVYPVGRLDYDSEGLLVLTNDTKLNKMLLDPANGHEREYWVQVEGAITDAALLQLKKGVDINVKGKIHYGQSVDACAIESPDLPERNPPVRFRKSIPTSWVSIVLSEGKNRQVRKMMAAVGFPVLRLVRVRMATVTLKNMQPGEMISFDRKAMYDKLFGK